MPNKIPTTIEEVEAAEGAGGMPMTFDDLPERLKDVKQILKDRKPFELKFTPEFEALIEKVKEFWDKEYPGHNSNGWITTAAFAERHVADVLAAERSRVCELKVQSARRHPPKEDGECFVILPAWYSSRKDMFTSPDGGDGYDPVAWVKELPHKCDGVSGAKHNNASNRCSICGELKG